MAAAKGNRYAENKGEWKSALKLAMGRKGEGDWRRTLGEIADTVVALAISGDREAWREIADRLDGKPAQTVEMNVTRTTVDLSDGELAAVIASGSGAGTAASESGPTVATGLH